MIIEQAQKILENYPEIKEEPSSISGKYHNGETAYEHLQQVVRVMGHLCDEFAIQAEERDLLLASAWLHDLGLYVITVKGEVTIKGWKYYPQTGWSRCVDMMQIHPILSATTLDKYEIDRKQEIQSIVSSHMSHWYPNCPAPKSFKQQLLCIADYLATRKNLLQQPKKGKV